MRRKVYGRKKHNTLVQAIVDFKNNHPDLYEFIMFNLLSNIATITNFVVLWLSTLLLFPLWCKSRGIRGLFCLLISLCVCTNCELLRPKKTWFSELVLEWIASFGIL